MGHLTGERCESGFEYRAPEQFANSELADTASDLYALGCVLHLLLTGLPPFPAATMEEAAEQHRYSPLPSVMYLRPDVPAGVMALMTGLLAKHPAARPASAEVVAAVLEPYATTEDSAAVIDFSLPQPGSFQQITLGSELTGLADAETGNLWAQITASDTDEIRKRSRSMR
jgi:serine/threonine protein kinase